MPLIRCPLCGQAYNIPPAVAVKLPTSVANCSCGQWLCGSREALLQRMSETGRIDEINVEEFKVDTPEMSRVPQLELEDPSTAPAKPRSLRIIARGADESIDSVFTVFEHPLWIGRRGCHIEFDDAELSIQHCSIEVRGENLFVRDAESYTGTFLDGQQIDEAEITDGTHLLRVGSALLCIEAVSQPGVPVEPVNLDTENLREAPALLAKKFQARRKTTNARWFIRGVGGPATGNEYEIGDSGATIGREGSIKVPDEYLSRKHFEIFWDEEGNLRIRDLGSRNGTFLNTLPAKNTKIHSGDEIRAGMTVFRVELK